MTEFLNTTSSANVWTNCSTLTTTWPITSQIVLTTPVTPSAGHVPSYKPKTEETELEWLRRRVTEVTDLFPTAA